MFEAPQAQGIPLQPTPAPTPPPAQAPQAPQVPGTPVAPQGPSPQVNLSQYTANQLRRMLEELKGQRQELADRRQTIGGQYERATGDNREGIGERLRILDASIVAYEAEITRVGRELATKSPGQTAEPPRNGQVPPGYVREDEVAGGMFGMFIVTLVVSVFFTRRFMRKKYGRVPQAQQPQMIGSNERLDRIEQAVDTIAVEIERVSENQRFMTRLMTETQLGDTIKDVRKSTELAKSAAADNGD